MTSTSNISDTEAVTTIKQLLDDNDGLVHMELAIHWMNGEMESTREEIETLIEEYSVTTTDNHGNDAITGIKDEYKDLIETDDSTPDESPDTIDLVELDGIGEGKSAALQENDIHTIQDVLNASREELIAIDGINEATVDSAKQDATRFVDSIEVTASDCAETERENRQRATQHTAFDIQVPAGTPTSDHFNGLPILSDPDEFDGKHPFVPSISHEYHESPVEGVSMGFGASSEATFTTNNTDVEVACKILADNDFCLALRGQTGVGKNVLLKYISSKTNRPVIRANFGQGMTYEDLVGQYTLETDDEGNQVLKWVDGLLTLAARYGWIFIADEMNAAPPECTMPLHAITEEDPELVLKKKGEVIKPHPSFRFVATMNPPEAGKYGGTNKMNEAFKTRFYTIDIDYLPKDKETALVKEKVNSDRHIADEEDIEGMVKTANRLRDRAREGDNMPTASTREIIKAAKLCDIMDPSDAFQTVIHGMMEPEHDEEAINEAVKAYL